MKRFSTKHRAVALALGGLTTAVGAAAALPFALARAAQSPPPAATPLITGKQITLPPLGAQTNVGSLPMHLITSPDGRFAVVSDMGFRQRLTSLRTSDGSVAGSVPFDNRRYNPANGPSYGLYYGLAVAGDGTLYAAQGGNDSIAVLDWAADGALSLRETFPTTRRLGVPTGAPGDFPAGLALDNRGYLYVANNTPSAFATLASGSPLVIEPGSLAIYDRASKREVGRFNFAQSFGGTANFPLALATLAGGGKTYVSSQRDGAVYVLNTSNPAAPTLVSTIPSGAHPIGLLLNKNQTLLFVANAHSDTVSVINTANDQITRTILLRPEGARGLAGATPTGLALSPDEKTLYVTLGDMNAVAVIDTDRYRIRGYVPVGWYPSAVAVSPGNDRLLVANAKGTTLRYPNPGFTEYTPQNDQAQYGLNLIEGNVQTIPLPLAPDELADYTRQVIVNNRITPLTDKPARNPLQAISRQAGKIKHVIYVVKENRTYDQMLGDLPQGNGDPSLTLFPRNVTPNQHALAERFALLDNFYVCGEASGDGWPWTTQAMASEYVIKNLPYNYSGRGRQYDFEGQNNGYLTGGHPATGPDGERLSDVFPGGAPAIPDVAEAPGGHIWDLVKASGLSYRNFGFHLSFGVTQNGIKILPDNYPASAGLLPAGRDLAGVSDIDFRRYDMAYADSDGPEFYAQRDNDPACRFPLARYGRYNAPSRFSEFKREFDQMIAGDPSGNSVPAFLMVRFPTDHTDGFRAGRQTPRAYVADNDYAVGQLVELISKSPIWKNSLIVVLEDDAQAGPDHVDFHRSVCFVISPHVRRETVDHTFHNTNSALRTMELALNLPPMNQYDAVATPFGFFDDQPTNDAPYTAILPAKEILCEKNPPVSALAPGDPRRKLMEQTATIKLDTPDSMGDKTQLFNQIIWKSVKGADSKMPAPVDNGFRAAGLFSQPPAAKPGPKPGAAATRR